MSAILWRSSLRYLFQHPWQVGLSILGVALGVAVVVSIDLANQSAKRSFNLSTDAVAGRATHLIVAGPSGLPEEVYTRLRVEGGIRNIAPVVEGYATLPNLPGRTFKLLGIDPFAEAPFRSYLSDDANVDIRALIAQPNTVLLAKTTAGEAGLVLGQGFQMNVGGFDQSVRLVGLMEPANSLSEQALSDVFIADIATAQELLRKEGRLSRIDVSLLDSEAAGPTLETIRAMLPPGVEIVRASARSESVEQLTRAFDLNLRALSMLALVVGTFLIYNTMTFSVLQRRALIGVLRAIGVTRRQVFALIMGEALVIGLVSSVLGATLGVFLGRALVQVVTRTINDLFFVVTVRELSIEPSILLKGGLLGVAATLIAALIPAIEATSVATRIALTRSAIETRARKLVPVASFGGGIIFAIGVGLMLIPGGNLVLSFGGMLALMVGLALLIPLGVVLASRMAAPIIGGAFGLTGKMAARDISRSLSRSAVAIAALAVAVSITVGMGTMVNSFRTTVENWLETSLVADVYVAPTSLFSRRVEATLAPEVLRRMASAPGVESYSTYRSVHVMSSSGEVQLVALGTSPQLFRASHRFKEGDPETLWDDFDAGDAVIISEPYAYHNGLSVGSTISLKTDTGDREFRVSGVYYDYANSRGAVMMSRNAYDLYWDDDGVSSIGLYASAGSDVDALVESLRGVAGEGQSVIIRSNASLREASLEVFDRSFAITSVLRVLAMIVAFVGVLSALMALQLERARELGVLRALGFTPGQVWGLVTTQTGLMGLLAGLFALPMGLVMAAGLVFVVNRRSFGWSLQMDVPAGILIEAVVLAVVAALVAGIYPGIRMARSSAADALRGE
ncbi:MAG: ABC transporter permease [Chloroflexi bacterium]|nr:ABC transporter permease [Chloroflexota bacterium]